MLSSTVVLSIIVVLTYGGMAYATIRYPKEVIDLSNKIKSDISKIFKK